MPLTVRVPPSLLALETAFTGHHGPISSGRRVNYGSDRAIRKPSPPYRLSAVVPWR